MCIFVKDIFLVVDIKRKGKKKVEVKVMVFLKFVKKIVFFV